PAELMGDELQTVADAEHRLVIVEDAVVNVWRIGVIDRTWAAAQDYAGRIVALDLVPGCIARQHDGEDVEFADATRDQLCVLRAEVEDDDGLSGKVTFGSGRLYKGFHVLF